MIHREPGDTPPPPPPRPPRQPGRGRNILRLAAVILLVLALTARGAAVAWTDYLWFSSLDFSGVWTTLVFTRIFLVIIAVVEGIASKLGASMFRDAISGQLTGINSVAALSFMVQDPRGIMELVRERSLFSRRLI